MAASSTAETRPEQPRPQWCLESHDCFWAQRVHILPLRADTRLFLRFPKYLIHHCAVPEHKKCLRANVCGEQHTFRSPSLELPQQVPETSRKAQHTHVWPTESLPWAPLLLPGPSLLSDCATLRWWLGNPGCGHVVRALSTASRHLPVTFLGKGTAHVQVSSLLLEVMNSDYEK